MLNNNSKSAQLHEFEKYLDSRIRDIRSPKRITVENRNVIRLLVLITSDLIAIILGWYLSNSKPLLIDLNWSASITGEWLFSVVLLGLVFLVVCNSYKRGRKTKSTVNSVRAVTLTYFVLAILVLQLYKNYFFQFVIAWLVTGLLIVSFRLLIFKVLLFIRERYFSLKIKVALIGYEEDIEKCLSNVKKSKEFTVTAQLDLSEFDSCRSILTAIDKLDRRQVDEILICSWEKLRKFPKIFWKLRCSGIYWQIIQLDSQVYQQQLEITKFGELTGIRVIAPAITGIDFISKRIFDISISFLLMFVLSIPMLLIAMLIKLDSSGPILYKQVRVGLNGKHFKVWKFRTMVNNAGELQKQLEARNEVKGGVLFKIKNDPRITKIGKHLRRYSIDELPQLFNVLRGEMSLVGPRPLPVRDVSKFSVDHHFRHEVLPGITGLWQISGRSNTDSENAFRLDFEYIQNWSLALDFEILFKTFGVVLNSNGAY
ncbi:MAG: sugar transferase [Cyanobacteria bacterium P01_G01_bin.19]